MTRIPLTGRSAPPRSRLARALAAAVVVFALGATSALGAVDAATVTDQQSAATATDATPTPIGTAPTSPDPATPPANPVTDPTATPVAETPPPAPTVDPTAPEPTATTPPATDPATTPAPSTGTPATPPTAVTVPDSVGPDAVTGIAGTPAAGGTIAPATLPGSGTSVTAPEPAETPALPIAARGADTPPAITKPVKPAVTPVVAPDLTPRLGDTTVLGNQAVANVPAPQLTVPLPRQQDPSQRRTGTTDDTVRLMATLEIPLRATSSDTRGSLLQMLAGYVFPGASGTNSGAIILLFTVALLLATVTPRIPRLHLTTLVAQRGAGCPGYNPVALRPG